MGLLQCHKGWSKNQEISPEIIQHDQSNSNSLSSQQSLASVLSLTTSKQPLTSKHHHVTTYKAHTSSISSLTISGKYIYSGSSDNQIRVWPRDREPNLASWNNLIARGESSVKCMVVSGGQLLTGHQDNKIHVWEIDKQNLNSTRVATLPTLNDRFGKMFLAKSYVKVRRNKTCTWVHHVDAVTALALSRDGSLLYSASWDRTFKVWRTSDFKCLESVPNAHEDAINAIVVSDDGYIYTGSTDKKIKVWKKEASQKKHKLVDTLEKHKSAVNALALSPDGSVLYSGACDRFVLVWEKLVSSDDETALTPATHMAVAGALRGHSMAILCISVVGDLVISGSADKTIRIFRRGINGKKYHRVCVLEGHNGPVKCLAAAVDSCTSSDDCTSGTSYLVCSGSLDCDVNVWKVWVPFL